MSDESYDPVYSFGVVHHTPHPERVLDKIRNYVRPGGTPYTGGAREVARNSLRLREWKPR